MRHAGCRGVAPAAAETGRAAAAAVEDHGRGLLGALGGFGILLLLLRLHDNTHSLTQAHTDLNSTGKKTTPDIVLSRSDISPESGKRQKK